MVVTQPDRPVGRKQKQTPCPIKQLALQIGLSVLSPEKIKESLAKLSVLQSDLFVVAAYGQYIPSSILALPPHGAINFHPSLLPKYRGASPIQGAIANGDSITGVTILYVSEKMDSGDILLQQNVSINPDATSASLEPILATVGAELLIEAIEQIRTGTVHPRTQNEAMASETRKLTKKEGRIDWTLPAIVLKNRIRAWIPWPGCFCEIPSIRGSQHLKILRVAVENKRTGAPGYVLETTGDGLLISTGDGALRLIEVQPAGKRVMACSAYLRGSPIPIGTRLL